MHKLRTYFVPLSPTPTAVTALNGSHHVGKLVLDKPAVVLGIYPQDNASYSLSYGGTQSYLQAGYNPDGLRLLGQEKYFPTIAAGSFHMLDVTEYEAPEGVYDIRMNLPQGPGLAFTARVDVLELDRALDEVVK